MTTAEVARPDEVLPSVPHVGGWLLTTDHKRIAAMTLAVATFLFFGMGVLALIMRSQLAQPGLSIVSHDVYNQIFTIHGSGMIYLVITPFAIALGVYLVPLQIGAPAIAAPKTTMLGFWLYVIGAVSLLSGFALTGGAGSDGWTAYPPLSDSQFTQGKGMDLWMFGVFVAVLGMILMSATLLWTVLMKRMPTMTMLRLPVFTWSMVVSVLMVLGAFPSLLAALGLLAVGRMDPSVFDHNIWNIGFQHLFWFYGHPVVYVMFFPFVGAVAEVLSTFAGRPFSGYKPTVFSLLAFAALSMSVWGHHMFTTGQATNGYYQLTSTLLLVPAGIEYFGMLSTLIGGKLRFPVPMLFALAFIPQFLVGGLTGIMVATPGLDYHAQDSYFVVGHFHYTLLAGSVFGLFAGFYFWFPKVTGVMLREGLGKLHFWLMVVGTNVTFLPFFALGMLGMPRRVATYPDLPWWGTLNLISTIGAGILGLAMIAFAMNIALSLTFRQIAPADPWGGHTLEWVTSSPPPPMNFNADWPLPRVTSFTPLLDLRKRAAARAAS
ncbi:MAG TPA: cbb3-type cytochrome c oxidase subunit I [Mycobacteriales bacterium]|nr:cbb3-type cytochrome c oxidase subunit I [Mycobacteriales bacterium]